MRIDARVFWLPKAGNSDAEYEDAFWPRTPQDNCQVPFFRSAAADGATETSYSRVWAKLLVRAIGRDALFACGTIQERLPDLQRRWLAIVRRRFRKRALPWYAEEKMLSGACAAFVGVDLREDGPGGDDHGKWRAIALGDSCLVQMRGEQILTRFPLERSESFTNRPHLLSSNPVLNDRVLEHLRTMESTWESGDAFYLMTDALACWFMKGVEEGQTPWTVLRDLETNAQIKPFRNWIEDLHTDKAIRNDDVTLLRIDIA